MHGQETVVVLLDVQHVAVDVATMGTRQVNMVLGTCDNLCGDVPWVVTAEMRCQFSAVVEICCLCWCQMNFEMALGTEHRQKGALPEHPFQCVPSF